MVASVQINVHFYRVHQEIGRYLDHSREIGSDGNSFVIYGDEPFIEREVASLRVKVRVGPVPSTLMDREEVATCAGLFVL